MAAEDAADTDQLQTGNSLAATGLRRLEDFDGSGTPARHRSHAASRPSDGTPRSADAHEDFATRPKVRANIAMGVAVWNFIHPSILSDHDENQTV